MPDKTLYRESARRGMALTRSGANIRGLSSSLLSALLCSNYNCFVGMSQYFSLGSGHTDAYEVWNKEM